ncbi:histone H1.3-like [Xiphophorus couchianus]|uniref:histone H1.3-like n=1 Tax=Xiphophorus couchianus TaxID=32473 RepID=UPI001016FCCA|nr:histone H1.3-like [Xiphophorus couchianus]
MKKKNGAKKALQGGVKENASISLKTKEKKLLGVSKQQNNPSKNPAGRGLGKAGAKRLGRLLKRVVQPQEEPAAVAALPKTPVRLFKHQIEKKADNAPAAKFSKQQVSKLILNVVSQCKHKGGISMDELKETLAAEGYDVAKNNRQVKVVTEQLVNNKTLVRTTRNTSLRLNKKVIKTKSAKLNKATSQKPPQELWKKTPAKRNPEEETKAQKNNKNPAKAKAKIQKMQRNTDKAAPKSKKQKKQSPKPKRKPQKRARKRPQLRKNRCMRAQTPPAKTTKTHRHQPKQVKSSRRKQPQRRKLPKRSSKRQKKHRKSYRRS